MSGRTMPYTHWAYFDDRSAADACAAELAALDCLVGIDQVDDGDESDDETPEWLVRAARTVGVDELVERHDEVEAIVNRHGGRYDGGESGWMDTRTGQFI